MCVCVCATIGRWCVCVCVCVCVCLHCVCVCVCVGGGGMPCARCHQSKCGSVFYWLLSPIGLSHPVLSILVLFTPHCTNTHRQHKYSTIINPLSFPLYTLYIVSPHLSTLYIPYLHYNITLYMTLLRCGIHP